MSWNVVFSQGASADLYDIYNYIAVKLQSPENAMRTYFEIIEAIVSLDEMPERNPKYQQEPLFSKGVRKIIVKNYIVLYMTNQDRNEVIVLAVVYGKRNISKVLDEK